MQNRTGSGGVYLSKATIGWDERRVCRFPCRLYVNEFGLSCRHRNPVFEAIFVVTVIAPIRPLFDSDLYRQAEAFFTD